MATTPVTLQRKLFTVDEYEQMVRAGVLGEDDRLELISGEIVEMSPIGALHMQVVTRLTTLLIEQLHRRAIVTSQNPIRLPNSEPQPDVVVLRPEAFQHVTVPAAGDALLVIEVSDSTAANDRTVKVPLYASSGIPETWLVDLQEQIVEVYRSPAPGRYRELQTLTGADVASPQFLPGVHLSVDEIFGTA